MKSWLLKGFLLLFSTGLAFGAVELTLRVHRGRDRFLPYHTNTLKLHYPSPEITPGVSGVSRFTSNSLGTRGPEPNGESVRILTMGGSTTADTILDDEETWAFLLMKGLNERAGDERFAWVTNSGVDGHNSHHHIMHARYLLPRLPRIDIVVLYAGLNDLGMWLYAEEFDPDYLDDPVNRQRRLAEAFRVCNYSNPDSPWYKRFEIWKRASIVKDRLLSAAAARDAVEAGRIVQDAQLEWLRTVQEHRQQTEKTNVPRAKLETLPVALDAYGENLREILALVRANGAEPVFVAQAIQDQFVSEEERQRFWMGAMAGGKSYVDMTEMRELLRRFNRRMEQVAGDHGVLFIDLPEGLQGGEGLFYDACHFNEAGAARAAECVADALWEELFDSARDR